MGGGFGIHYRRQEAPSRRRFCRSDRAGRQKGGLETRPRTGPLYCRQRSAGILVSRVIYTKDSGGKSFIIQDAAMNDLIRPTLYDAFHRIWPVAPPYGFPTPPDDYEADIPGTAINDVVGPVCETGDYLARDRRLPPVKRGDLLATFSAGAYGMAMSSNYNSRPRAAEVLVDGKDVRLIRRRETYEDLVRPEREID
ncbi:MAG: hypothetical protein KatS3mg105_1220 [Gemmatales bacterium]|nr:MAG: hypothetical protein KatS3mg105_1220 [Gemmatales bacterium]